MASNTDLRIFSIEEANVAIEDLKKTLPALRRALKEIERFEDRLEVLDLICNRAVAAENADLQEYLTLKVQYHQKITEFEGLLVAMETEGYLLRDLERGVVHFVAQRGTENVLLCWCEGETEITHWHSLDKPGMPDEDRRLEIEDWDAF